MAKHIHSVVAAGLLVILFILAGGAALHESAAVDEVAHVGAGLSYLQQLDLRLNAEHPPLAKVVAGLPLALRGVHADYSAPSWKASADFISAYGVQWIFGDAVLGRWNDWNSTLMWARLPMLALTLLLGWIVYRYGSAIGGAWGGLLCLAAYVTTPAILVFGPLVITDLPVTLFSVVALWQLGAIWDAPSPRNGLLFGLAVAAAMLSKFTGLLIVPIVILLFLQTQFWPTAAQPREKEEWKEWRRTRFHCVMRGLLVAAVAVYVFYFVFSWNQPNDALDRIGSGKWASLIRRPLMPVWLYVRGLVLMLLMGSRTTFLFGHTYSHGVPYYFPVVFALKSTLGFLLLLLLAGFSAARSYWVSQSVIPQAIRSRWHVLILGLAVFLVVCLLSQLDISIRHFLMPIVLLTILLAPLPRLIDKMPGKRFLQLGVAGLVVSCFVSVLGVYPYFFPFVNSLAFGRPVYYLVNDSNVTWNEGLPAVEQFVKEQHLSEVRLDWASLSDPTLVVPEAQTWDCQTPAATDAGHWAAVTAVSILENHNCGYLMHYPHRELAGGAFYVFKLPVPIPAAGTRDGPPQPALHKSMWAMQFNLRDWSVNVERHPQELPAAMQVLMKNYQQQANKAAP